MLLKYLSAALVLGAQAFENGKVFRLDRDPEISTETWGALGEYIPLQMGEYVDVWNANQQFIDVQVVPEMIDIFIEFMDGFKLVPSIMVDDVQELIRQTKPVGSRKAGASFNYTTYNDIDSINQWMTDMATKYSYISLDQYGKSSQGRIITGMKISPASATPNNVLILNAGIHAREWIAPAHLMLVAQMMIDNYEAGDATMVNVFNNVDLYLIPISNPDGYVYTWTTDRSWRKTRSDYENRCVGVDPNRNWDAHWSQPNGASTNPCAEAYKGPTVWSEPCVTSLRDYVNSIQADYSGGVAFMDLHAYSQMIMYPYGYKHGTTPFGPTLETIVQGMSEAILATNGLEYVYGPIADTIYVASGNTVDYFTDTTGINCAFAAELRDTGKFGFMLPESQIQPQANEMYNAYLVLFDAILAGNCPKISS